MSDEHRVVNPAKPGGPDGPRLPAEKREAVRVPFVDEHLAIDPESLKVWELRGDGPLPKTDGFRVNVPCPRMNRPTSVCLSVTRDCNLRCRYCYVHNRPDIQGGSISVEDGVSAIKLCQPKGTSISFFGGEPLLHFDVIKGIVAEAERFCESPRFHVTTNGILLDDEKAGFFKEHGFTFIVSIDGPPHVHNLNRPLVRQDGIAGDSYALTIEGLGVLRRHEVAEKVTLRSTYTKDCACIAERVAHLNDLCEQGLGGHVSVEPVSSSESSCIDPRVGEALGFSTADALALQDEYKRAFDWALERAAYGKRTRWHHLNHFAERVISRRPKASECGAAMGYMSVAPDGAIFACHREAGAPIGHVARGLDERTRACWLDNRLFVRRDCPDCWCRFICGGGCRADSVVHGGDISVPYATACAIMQIVIANTIRVLSKLDEEQQTLVTRDGAR